MSFSFDIETLLQPLCAESPCGVSLLHDPSVEAIKAARREDDPSLPTGVWQTELKVADWSAVETRCVALLSSRSKDLMVAAWLAEAWLHRYGWEALPVGIGLIEALCERFWDGLHPLPRDGDWGFRAAPLAWIAGQFPGLLGARVGLCERGEGEGAFTLSQWESTTRLAITLADRKDVPAARREEATRDAEALHTSAQAARRPVLAGRLAAMRTAQGGIARLDAWSNQHLGDDAPAFGPLLNVLERASTLLKEWVPMDMIASPKEINAADAPGLPEDPSDAPPPTGMGTQPFMPVTRDGAYQQLALIGEFLMRYEPHSPVPYMIQRALEWGKMPLPELLQQLTEAGRGRMLGAALGLLPAES
ncbi:type VI secretion system protein TssA [Paraburkholderia sp. J67]|uniref:type VI secretion system protein TssA n=1 Tax=Paraburkholderia sp. J67 TaxID=2805435 RepID=UPI002ABDC5C4|nr:type VI secretion system protein TssA [Paraburkholderia sp. J67]